MPAVGVCADVSSIYDRLCNKSGTVAERTWVNGYQEVLVANAHILEYLCLGSLVKLAIKAPLLLF